MGSGRLFDRVTVHVSVFARMVIEFNYIIQLLPHSLCPISTLWSGLLLAWAQQCIGCVLCGEFMCACVVLFRRYPKQTLQSLQQLVGVSYQLRLEMSLWVCVHVCVWTESRKPRHNTCQPVFLLQLTAASPWWISVSKDTAAVPPTNLTWLKWENGTSSG